MTYLNQIAPSVAAIPIHVPTLVGLAVAMDLLRTMELTMGGKTETYYLPTDLVDASHPFQSLASSCPLGNRDTEGPIHIAAWCAISSSIQNADHNLGRISRLL
jgi:hypothetical protein